jgi:hypothetical protein
MYLVTLVRIGFKIIYLIQGYGTTWSWNCLNLNSGSNYNIQLLVSTKEC